MFFITTLVLLFLIKIRFPNNRLICNTIRLRYGVPTLHIFRNLEKAIRRKEKLECDIKYLQACLHYKVIPKFLRIKLYKKCLENTEQCRSLQLKLLHSEIRFKERRLAAFSNKVPELQASLGNHVSRLDNSCIHLWLRRKQDKVTLHTRTTHDSKLQRLVISPIAVNLNPEKVVFNYSDHILTKTEKEALLLGLDFNLPIRNINYFKYFLVLENFTQLSRI